MGENIFDGPSNSLPRSELAPCTGFETGCKVTDRGGLSVECQFNSDFRSLGLDWARFGTRLLSYVQGVFMERDKPDLRIKWLRRQGLGGGSLMHFYLPGEGKCCAETSYERAPGPLRCNQQFIDAIPSLVQRWYSAYKTILSGDANSMVSSDVTKMAQGKRDQLKARRAELDQANAAIASYQSRSSLSRFFGGSDSTELEHAKENQKKYQAEVDALSRELAGCLDSSENTGRSLQSTDACDLQKMQRLRQVKALLANMRPFMPRSPNRRSMRSSPFASRRRIQ